jgi:hypothetical protein
MPVTNAIPRYKGKAASTSATPRYKRKAQAPAQRPDTNARR